MTDYVDGRRVMPGVPKPEYHRRHPAVDYLMRTYAGNVALMDVAMEVAEMLNDGVTVSNDLIDHLFKTHQRDHLRRWQVARQRHEESVAPPPPPPESFVYFIQHGDNVKIGVSLDPGRRAAALSLRESNVLAVISGDRKLERQLHAKFAAHRVGDTEWFTLSDEIRAYIDLYAERFTKHHRSRRGRGEIKTPEQGYAALARRLTSSDSPLLCE